MMKFEVGKLYVIYEQFYWLIFPTKELAEKSLASPEENSAEAAIEAEYLGSKLNCNISLIFPEDIFCCIEQDNSLIKILPTHGNLGWIRYPTPHNAWKNSIKEVK